MPSAIAAAGMALAGGVVSAVGAEKAAHAKQDELNYQAQIARNNEVVANRNAEMTAAAGEQQATNSGLKSRQQIGGIKAAQAANGVDVNVGSAVDVRSSAEELGQLDALTIRSNAAREAYGQQVQAQNYGSQAELDVQGGKNAREAGDIDAISSILGGASSAAGKYSGWQQSGGGGGALF